MAENQKTQKLKGSDIDTEKAVQARKRQPGAQGAGEERDAIPSGELDKKKLKENQERLGQTPEHKTEDMDEEDRGTYP